MYGYIYKITNLINEKVYIGQHKSVSTDDSYFGSGKNLKRAITKYGKENFQKEILCMCDTKDELNDKEIYYIEHYKSRDPNIGYNIAKGGHERFFTGCHHSEESKLKMSDKAKCRPHPPTTTDTFWVNNGADERMVRLEWWNSHQSDGWEFGRITQVGGNLKGHTKYSSETLKKVSENRIEALKAGAVGCCGYGDANPNRKRFLEKVNNINRDDFLSDLENIGKVKTLEKYKIGNSKYNEVLEILHITDKYSYKLKKTG